MNSKTTWRLFLLAAGLFGFIYFIERGADSPTANAKPPVFARVTLPAVTGVEIHFSNQVLRAERTNDSWRLATPPYPAQSTPIESFIENLIGLEKQAAISPSEVTAEPTKLKAFGLDPPMAKISLIVGSNRHHLHLGTRVTLSDQIYAQMAGSGEVIVIDSGILKSIPTSSDAWRNPQLVHLAGRPFDHLQIRAGQRLLEIERDATNQVWRITKPTPARVNQQRVLGLLQLLEAVQVKQFVTDSPAADLERFGLQAPELKLSYFRGTNGVASFEFGSSPTNDPGSIYALRLSSTNIVTVARELFNELNQEPKYFHDQQLISINVNEITQLRLGGTNGFAVTKMTNGLWQITEPAPMAADSYLMKGLLTNIQNMEIVDTAKDVPTDVDLKLFGLAPPRFSLGLYTTRTNATGALTNVFLTQVDFGTNKTVDTVYARRHDETPVYVTVTEENLLPREAWQLRDRRIFDFAIAEVVSITVAANGKTNRVDKHAAGWTTDVVENAAIEEALFRMGRLTAAGAGAWATKDPSKLAPLGITDKSLAFEFGVMREGTLTPSRIIFGHVIGRFIYAATTLPGDAGPTVFRVASEDFEPLAAAFHLQPQ